MQLLLKDDAGIVHPVLLDVSAKEIPELVAKARQTNAQLGERYGYQPEPVCCD